MEVFSVTNCPSTELSYTNKAIINYKDAFANFEHIAVRYPRENEAYVFSVAKSRDVGPGQIAFNGPGRKWARLQVNAKIEAAPYKFEPVSQCLNSITFLVDFTKRDNPDANRDFDSNEMAQQFSQEFVNQAFTVGQLIGFAFKLPNKRVVFELKVKDLVAINVDNQDVMTSQVEIGLTTANTVFLFEPAEGSPVKLLGGMTSTQAPQIFTQDWDFSNMGIGGLSEQFNRLFKNAFVSRLLPPQLAQTFGSDHVKGVLLYGPPGTGKTLIARQIGKMLLARPPKVVNGPEILNKFVGESEANIRALFKEAEDEQAKLGIHSGLHLIIFDEFDAICKQRGNSASSAGVGDNVVNQLLSKIDGVEALNNVLLIGMTNRKDLIDEAVLRPGRLEVHIEIGLPNQSGRVEIFKIHTKVLRDNNKLDSSVKLEELAAMTKNYTGAEIAGLVRCAKNNMFQRCVSTENVKIDELALEKAKVTREDFIQALQEIKPALGASEDQMSRLAMPMIDWDPIITTNRERCTKILQDLQPGTPYFMVFTGDPCSGLTTLAANMAKQAQFPFTRFFLDRNFMGQSELSRIEMLKKLFDDAAKSELSCIVIDNLDALFEYHASGRFSNSLRLAFRGLKNLSLQPGHKLLVICTCPHQGVLEELQLIKMFKRVVKVPTLMRAEQVARALNLMNPSQFSPDQRAELVEALQNIPFKMGIKELEDLIQATTPESPQDRVKLFLELIHSQGLVMKDLTSRLDNIGSIQF